MLEKNELELLEKLFRSSNIGVEDFIFNDIFNDGNSYRGFEHKYHSFNKLYNVYDTRKYTVSYAIETLNNINTHKLYDNIDKMKSMTAIKNALKDSIRYIEDLGTPNIEIIQRNIDGWIELAEKSGTNIDKYLILTESLEKDIEKYTNTILSPLISKLKDIYQDILNVSMVINTSEDEFSGYIQDLKEGSQKSLYVNYCFELVKNLKTIESHLNNNKLIDSLLNDSKIFENLTKYNMIRKNLEKELITDNKEIYYSYADKFLKSLNTNDIKDFLIQYKSDDETNNYKPEYLTKEIEIKEAYSKIDKVLVFDDLSFAIKNKEGNWKTFNELIDRQNLIQNIVLSDLAYKLRKSPTIAKMFIKKLKDNFEYNVEKAYVAADTYLNHEKLLKSKDFNLIETINEFEFEDLDDEMSKYIKKHKVEQYALSITSNKYKHLYDDITYKNFELLHDLKVPESDLQSYLGRKLAAFKNSKDFNNALKKFYNTFNGFEMDTMIEKAKKFGATVIANKNDVLLLKIHTFEQSKELGSSSWCISRDEVHFKSYSEDSHQYFVMDFKKDPIDREAMIGVTLNQNGTYSASHYKDDSQFFENDTFKVLQLEIIRNDIKNFKYLHADLKKEVDTKDKKTRKFWW